MEFNVGDCEGICVGENHKMEVCIHKMLYASLHQYFNVQYRHQHFILIMPQISWPRDKSELCKAAQPYPLIAGGSLQHPLIHGFCSSESRGCVHAQCTGGRFPAGLSLAWLLLSLPWGGRRSCIYLWELVHCLEPSSG